MFFSETLQDFWFDCWGFGLKRMGKNDKEIQNDPMGKKKKKIPIIEGNAQQGDQHPKYNRCH